MTRYPDSECEAHFDVQTSSPVCIICMGIEIDTQQAQLEWLLRNMSGIELRQHLGLTLPMGASLEQFQAEIDAAIAREKPAERQEG